MNQPQRGKQGRNPNQPISRVKFTANKGQQLSNAESGANTETTSNKHITGDISIIETKKWNRTEIIAGIAVVVSIVLAVVTYRLYRIASNDSENAKNATTIAQETLQATRNYDSLSLIKQQKSIDDNNASSQLTFDRASKSLRLQDSSIKETQKEFEIESRPLLQILNIKIDTLDLNKRLCVRFSFVNYGKQPIKALINKYQIDFGQKNKHFPMFISADWNYENNKGYLHGGAISTTEFRSDEAITKEDYTKIKNGDTEIYINGEFNFINTVTNNQSTYHYNYKLNYNRGIFNVEGIKDTTTKYHIHSRK